MDTSGRWIRVWDPIVRIGHWTLVVAFFTAYFTEDDLLTTHVWAGYVVAGVVVLRLVWGLIGSRHARFSDFVRSPWAVFGYLRAVAGGRARRYLGHNPAGAAMIVALMLSLAVTAGSGMMLYAYEEGAGPLAPLVAGGSVADTTPVAGREHGGRRGESEGEEVWEEVHELFANLTLVLVLLHVAGVALSSMAHRENLVRAMITGRKRVEVQG